MTTEKVFDIIYDSDEYVRGEAIAETLGITRTAINKHIKKLQSMGIQIDATRRGYKYISSDTLCGITLARKIADKKLPHNVIVNNVDSTNNAVKAMISNDPSMSHELLYIAPSQMSGKGRLGRVFESAEGGVYMTICYSPNNMCVSDSLKIVLLTGLCVAKVLEKYTTNVTIKWPNDVFVSDKKITGILLESVINEYSVDALIIGIGINISNKLSNSITDIATTLDEHCEGVFREDIIVQVTELLYNCLVEYEKTGFDSFLDDYISRSRTIGQVVTVTSGNKKITGEALGLSEDGYLLINNNGVIEKVIVGDVGA